MNFEILVTTMHQKDFSKIEQMNIHSNVLFANQADRTDYMEMRFEGNKTARMLTTTTRGVGVNRNLLLLYSEADIILLADDDLVYSEDLEQSILDAFEHFPKADVIAFGGFLSKSGKVFGSIKTVTKKLPVYKAMKFGTCFLAVKRNAMLKNNITFTSLFGGGCVFCHGEDSDFLLQCYKKRLRIYSYNYMLATISYDASSWFTGYDEKYFYDTGALAKHSFGWFAKFYMLYMAIRLKNETKIPFAKRWKLLMAGYENFALLKSYNEWKAEISID